MAVDALHHRSAERIIHMHVDHRLRRAANDLKDLLLVGKSVTENGQSRGKISKYEFEPLLSDIGRRRHIDDERNTFLFGDLRDGHGLAGIEGSGQQLSAGADQIFSALTRDINIRFRIAIYDLKRWQVE
jgi:hypothetical protein